MPVVYISFDVQMHGLDLRDEESLEALRMKVDAAMRGVHPGIRFDDDVQVAVDVTAGSLP